MKFYIIFLISAFVVAPITALHSNNNDPFVCKLLESKLGPQANDTSHYQREARLTYRQYKAISNKPKDRAKKNEAYKTYEDNYNKYSNSYDKYQRSLNELPEFCKKGDYTLAPKSIKQPR